MEFTYIDLYLVLLISVVVCIIFVVNKYFEDRKHERALSNQEKQHETQHKTTQLFVRSFSKQQLAITEKIGKPDASSSTNTKHEMFARDTSFDEYHDAEEGKHSTDDSEDDQPLKEQTTDPSSDTKLRGMSRENSKSSSASSCVDTKPAADPNSPVPYTAPNPQTANAPGTSKDLRRRSKSTAAKRGTKLQTDINQTTSETASAHVAPQGSQTTQAPANEIRDGTRKKIRHAPVKKNKPIDSTSPKVVRDETNDNQLPSNIDSAYRHTCVNLPQAVTQAAPDTFRAHNQQVRQLQQQQPFQQEQQKEQQQHKQHQPQEQPQTQHQQQNQQTRGQQLLHMQPQHSDQPRYEHQQQQQQQNETLKEQGQQQRIQCQEHRLQHGLSLTSPQQNVSPNTGGITTTSINNELYSVHASPNSTSLRDTISDTQVNIITPSFSNTTNISAQSEPCADSNTTSSEANENRAQENTTNIPSSQREEPDGHAPLVFVEEEKPHSCAPDWANPTRGHKETVETRDANDASVDDVGNEDIDNSNLFDDNDDELTANEDETHLKLIYGATSPKSEHFSLSTNKNDECSKFQHDSSSSSSSYTSADGSFGDNHESVLDEDQLKPTGERQPMEESYLAEIPSSSFERTYAQGSSVVAEESPNGTEEPFTLTTVPKANIEKLYSGIGGSQAHAEKSHTSAGVAVSEEAQNVVGETLPDAEDIISGSNGPSADVGESTTSADAEEGHISVGGSQADAEEMNTSVEEPLFDIQMPYPNEEESFNSAEGAHANVEEYTLNAGIYADPELMHSSYELNPNNPGKVLIINNIEFLNSEKRDGAEKDEETLTRTFRQKGWLEEHMIVRRNQKAHEIRKEIEDLARSKEKITCLFVCILSHGTLGFIHGVDELAVNIIRDVVDPLNETNCKHLEGVPKVFLIQACQEVSKEQIEPLAESAAPDPRLESAIEEQVAFDAPGNDSLLEPTTNCKNLLIVCSCKPNEKSLRHVETGSIFITEVERGFRKVCRRKDYDVERACNDVKHNVIAIAKRNGHDQVPLIKPMLDKKLYLRG